MIPYGRHEITKSDIDAIVAVLNSDLLTQGPMVPRFEKAVSEYCSAQHALAVNSATSALHIACLALDLGLGDWLWTTPTSFVASANCALYCNASVDFVDIDPRTYNICPQALEQKLIEAEKLGCLPKIVIPVHLCGQPCDMLAIYSLVQRFGFKIIEDASHAIGGKYKGEPIGNCRYSDITIFSFHPVKIITTGEGGMALTNSSIIADRMLRYRVHGITNDASKMHPRPVDEIWNYQQINLGFNYRMTDLQAALGLSQLQRLDEIVAERNRQFQIYRELLTMLPVHLLAVPDDVLSSLHLAVIRFADPRPEHHRRVFEGLRDSGIGVQLHYSPVHLHPYYRQLGFGEGDFPEAEAYARNAISLPLYPGLTLVDQQRVDLLLRGVAEIEGEQEVVNRFSDGVVLDPHVLVVYPFAGFFYVSPDNKELADAVTAGFEKIIRDGSYQQLLESQVYTSWLRDRLKLKQRHVIFIPNPEAHGVLDVVSPQDWIVPWGLLADGTVQTGEQLCTIPGLAALCN